VQIIKPPTLISSPLTYNSTKLLHKPSTTPPQPLHNPATAPPLLWLDSVGLSIIWLASPRPNMNLHLIPALHRILDHPRLARTSRNQPLSYSMAHMDDPITQYHLRRTARVSVDSNSKGPRNSVAWFSPRSRDCVDTSKTFIKLSLPAASRAERGMMRRHWSRHYRSTSLLAESSRPRGSRTHNMKDRGRE
jgi:hypothetical protein